MPDDAEIESRFESLRGWSPSRSTEDDWDDIRSRARAKRRRVFALAGTGMVAFSVAVIVGIAALSSTSNDGADVITRASSPTSSVVTAPTTTLPTAAFAHLASGWHEIDTGSVPGNLASLAWSGTELLVVTDGRMFGYEPVAEDWREFPALPPDELGSTVSIVAMDGPILAVMDSGQGQVQSAMLAPDATEWETLDVLPTGISTEFGVQRGPVDPNYQTSLVWTGERVIDSTHGAVFDPTTRAWTALPFPADLLSYTHLLYANPVWDGNALVMAYPYTLPGLAFDSTGSNFQVFDGIDSSLVETSAIGPGFGVLFGDDVFFVSDDGFAATYASREDEWTVLPPVPGVDGGNACPGHAAPLGDSVVVEPCYGEPPVYLVDGAWVEVDEFVGGPCCAGSWLGVDGALVVWDAGPVPAEDPWLPIARVWIPPQGGEASAPSTELVREPGWTQVPGAPLSARTGAAVESIGSEVFVLGGWSFTCPPAADCSLPDAAPFADGAVLNIETGVWASTADAPMGFHDATSAVVGDDVYLLVHCEEHPSCPTGRTLFRYRTSDDEWDSFEAAPEGADALTTFRGSLIAYSTSDERGAVGDYIFDPSRQQWIEIAPDPLPPVYDRVVVEYDERLLVFGTPLDREQSGKIGASFDPDSGQWTVLPTAASMGYQVWIVGDRAVLNPHFGRAGGGVLDLQTGEWSLLPDTPVAENWRGDMAGLIGSGEAHYASTSGWILNADTDEWVEVGVRPGGADAFGESVTTTDDRRLVVFGGERWTATTGELLNELWVWTPPQ